MWTFIILTLALTLGFFRIMIGNHIESIISEWPKYRCKPDIMFWGLLFKPKDDPRSVMQFAVDNFEFCAAEIAKTALNNALIPVQDFSVKMSDSVGSAMNFNFNLKSMSGNLFNGLERIFDIFGRRFNLIIHEVHKSFAKQYHIAEKANTAAISTIFAGISMIQAIMNFWKLLIIVVISILVILVVLVIFFFYLLFPTIPLILTAVAIIGATAMGSSVDGMGDAFCFHPNTNIILQDGTTKRIDAISMNDILMDGSSVTSILKMKTDNNTLLYNIDGVIVSGSHIIYVNGQPTFVKTLNHPVYVGEMPGELYCLNSSSHKILIKGASERHVFADWEELDSGSMADWSAFVSKTLNSGACDVTSTQNSILESESGFSPSQIVSIKRNERVVLNVALRDVKNGDLILDLNNAWTEVIGTVIVNSTENNIYGSLDNIAMSGATWIYDNDSIWKHAAQSQRWISSNLPVSDTISLFTRSGTFKIDNTVFRDFSDIGISAIHMSYDFTLEQMKNPVHK